MIPLMTILIKCLCTPIAMIIGVLYFLLALITWRSDYGDKGADVLEDLWKAR
jgi:hypothetical protein